jgi:hypothetical protein
MKASNNHKIKILMMLCKYKKHDYISQVVTQEMEASHQRQRDVIAKLQSCMLEEFKYDRVLAGLIWDLANFNYFINNAWITGLKRDKVFDQLFT